jgi:DNA-binding NarL/FixJ family response regulator
MAEPEQDVRIPIADDHAMFRDAVRNLLEQEQDLHLMGEAADEVLMGKQSQAFRILLADKQTIFRVGLSSLLSCEPDFEVVGEAADDQEAVKLAGELKPDILLLDLSMPGNSAMEALRRIPVSAERCRTLVLATTEQKAYMVEAFRLGARGVLLKDSATTAVLIQAIRSVMKDMYWIVDRSVGDLVSVLRELAEPGVKVTSLKTYGLTRRELEIVSAIVSGFSNRQIAKRMSISESTIKHHLTNIFDKLGVYNRLELALFVIHHGLVEPAESPATSDERMARMCHDQ